MNPLYPYYKPFSYLLMKSLYYLADLICYKTGLSKSQLGKIVAIFHTWIIGYSYYELYFSSPIENKNYIFYYNFTFWVAFSNFVLNGCVLVKVERYLFENKEYLGPHNMLLQPAFYYLNINNYNTKKTIQTNFMMFGFLITLLYSKLRILYYENQGLIL